MTKEEIDIFIEKNKLGGKHFKISFKKRNPVYGFFIDGHGAEDLKSKNFWRIVSVSHLTEWNKTGDVNLSRLYQGSDFAKITVAI